MRNLSEMNNDEVYDTLDRMFNDEAYDFSDFEDKVQIQRVINIELSRE